MLSKLAYGSLDGAPKPVGPPPATPHMGRRVAPVALRDDQIVEKAMQTENLVEHGLLAIDKRISIVGEITSLSEGRDKIFKIFSGLLKVGRWILANYFKHWAFSAELQARFKHAGSATSTARAFLKLFTDWVFFRLAVRVYKKQHFGWLKVLTLGRLIGLALYFSLNIPIWFHTTKLLPHIDKDFWNKASLVAYIISTSCQFCMDFKKLYDMTKEIADLELFSTSSSHAPSGPRPTVFGIDLKALIAGLLHPSTSTEKVARQTQDPVLNTATIRLTKSDSYGAVLGHKNHVAQSTHAAVLRRYLAAYSTENAPNEANVGPQTRSATPISTSEVTHEEEDDEDENDVTDDATQSNLTDPSGIVDKARVYVPLKRPSLNALTSTSYRTALKDFESVTCKALDKEDTLRRNRTQLLINFLKDGGDFAGAFNGVFDWGWSDLTNGLIGINSAGISLWRLWTRYSSNINKQIREKQLAKEKARQAEAEQRALAALQEA